jgi:hypothetical protein
MKLSYVPTGQIQASLASRLVFHLPTKITRKSVQETLPQVSQLCRNSLKLAKYTIDFFGVMAPVLILHQMKFFSIWVRKVSEDNLYSSPNIIRMIKSRRMRWAGHVARMGETRNAYRILVRNPEGKRPLGRPRCRWMDNIKKGSWRDRMGW